MRRTLPAVVTVWLMGLTLVMVTVALLTVTSTNDLHTLLLNGKTASAISAEKTATEVKLLLKQQEFDHAQAVNGTKRLKVVVREVERHLDTTIRRRIDRATGREARAIERVARTVARKLARGG